MVEVTQAPDESGLCEVLRPSDKENDIIWADCLSPLPAADPLKEAVQELKLAATIMADEFDLDPEDKKTLTACRNHIRSALARVEAAMKEVGK